jgi:hypothetical protein
MPGVPHEVPLPLFRERPELLLDLLHGALGVDVPAYERVQIEEAEVAQILPPSYHADLVFSLHRGAPVMAIVLEVQRSVDPRKHARWPTYVADVHARVGCATYLVVFATSHEVARWAAKPIATFQPGSCFAPIVLGPGAIPVVTSADAAERAPELAVLSVLTHAAGDDEVARAAVHGIGRLDDDRRTLYINIILSCVAPALRQALEDAMNFKDYEFKSPFFVNKIAQARAEAKAQAKAEATAEVAAEAEAKGEAQALLAVLAARGLPVTDEARARILACRDLPVLERWVTRAVTAASIDDLFVDG